MFQSVRKNTQCQRLDLAARLLSGATVSHYARQIWDLGNPTAVGFVFELDSQHGPDLKSGIGASTIV